MQALRFDRHLYFPLLCLREKDDWGNKILVDVNTREPLVKVSPVPLNAGERTFVEYVRKYYLEHKEDVLAGKDVYLLRNESRKGIGFFEANNFYPDFILWVNDGKMQRVSFIDPKGIRNLRGLSDPKIQLFHLLKKEVEPVLRDDSIRLDSFIISNTPYREVSFWGEMPDFTRNHVLFQTEEDCMDKLFGQLLS